MKRKYSSLALPHTYRSDRLIKVSDPKSSFFIIKNENQKTVFEVFYDGQIFDAWGFVSGLIREAKKSIILIDNYIDDSVLSLLAKRSPGVKANIFTSNINKQLQIDLDKT